MLVRHGDRSAIGRIPKAKRGVFPCSEPSAASVLRAAALLAPARSSAACILVGGSPDTAVCREAMNGSPALTNATDRALRAWGVARSADEVCGKSGGELSSVGWAQLRATGAALSRAYSSLLTGEHDHMPAVASKPLQVVSTDTGRTALSSAAFVTGLVDGPVEGSSSQTFAATASMSSTGDVETSAKSGASSSWLRGQQLPLPLNIVPREEDPMLWPKKAYVCPRAGVAQHRAFDDIFQHQVIPPGLAERISELTGTPVDALPTAEECADDIATRSCHGHALPCWKVNATDASSNTLGIIEEERCLKQEDAALLIARCDQGYAYRYDNEITRLLSFPVLRQLADQMHRAALRAAATSAESISAALAATGGGVVPRLQFRAGHDTVIAPLLTALGAPDSPFSWPNYASRLGFELWMRPVEDRTEPFVKVLYNGENWTPRLKCAQRGADTDIAQACALADFIAQVNGLIAPHLTWEDACFTNEPHVKHTEGHSHPTKAGTVAHQSDVGPGGGTANETEDEDESGNDVGPGRAINDAPSVP